jgi:LytS/YehU family sensor histidine kinase
MSGLRNPKVWLTFAGVCLFLALVEATSGHFDALRSARPSDLGWRLAERGLADSIWLVVNAAVFATVERAMAARARAGAIAIRLALLGLVLVPLCVASGPVAFVLIHPEWELGERLGHVPLTTVLWDAFLYSMASLASGAFFMARRARRQELEKIELRARLAQAELELLRAQLEPHFLFNALHTIAGLVRSARHELATSALAQLSELLRYVIEASRQERVPLAWELEFVANYLKLQQARFGPRLQFIIHEDSAARACGVPPLLLQPLVENAVVHGAARTSDRASIEVRVAAVEAALRVEVVNTRDGADGGAATTGLGLRNTRQRLERMYGDAFRLDAGPDGARAYRVAISLPRAAA